MTYEKFIKLKDDIYSAVTNNIAEHDLQTVIPEVLLINTLSYLNLKKTKNSKYMILRLTENLEGNAEHLPQGISKGFYQIVHVAKMMYYNEAEIKFYENNDYILGYLE